ncbi:hypothetical protein Glove_92g56 [Diversispora epigaea]|uniref:Uncharacterized protein n=1 Tax=Diversispora epigaea TaxID=1348612 RepID=A0A397JFN5_9GLOM|nr:hypothetical protein Glove_92g56 [Diversispora epigaea]
MSGKLTYEENSVYSPEGVLISKCVPPLPGTRSWNIIDLYLSVPIPRFKAITSNRLYLNNFYTINGFLRQTTKYDDKVEFFIEAYSFDLLSVQVIPTQPQRSKNVSKTAPPDNFEDFIHKKFHSEQSLKCQRTNYDGTVKNLQEISSSDVQFLKPAISAHTVSTLPIKFTSITYDVVFNINLSLPFFPNPNSPNKNKFQAINHNPNKKISDFHNLDLSSFVLSKA